MEAEEKQASVPADYDPGRLPWEHTEAECRAAQAAFGTAPDAAAGHWHFTEAEFTAWRGLLHGSLAIYDELNRNLESNCGISLGEYEVLVHLVEARGHRLRMAQLAETVSFSRSRLTNTISRMEKRGLVTRGSCASDGRGVIAMLTRAGADFLAEVAPVHLRAVRERLVERLSEQQLSQLAEIMETLVPGSTRPHH
ncbi:MarR family winged helix-turn-helix transcriptional regulator [Buchananella hordeovulneris]|uniref:MarR family winged helix-turn-helix transcriptional regulator n=1 Tax=Buchananella hordeovulneris TaxID=52770 RepID=UPI000A04D6E8|nr:MarR family winged helix-turn-helix transcriptional regulator [Buchananella hordeovulneris]MDO5081764.1 MarR family winged helix-turn-helix transcriptional regulator [Buchananella hordeovulneris]RRD42717.1 MarR family transcriptional regulator [Buchananella hordeovulneris]RRD51936.1 MarR family transcriptional regulator [Buchananella hordeovulneris]